MAICDVKPATIARYIFKLSGVSAEPDMDGIVEILKRIIGRWVQESPEDGFRANVLLEVAEERG